MTNNKFIHKILGIWYPQPESNRETSEFSIKHSCSLLLNYVLSFSMQIILFILSVFYNIVITLRKFLYKIKIFNSYQSPIPVIVVGNITVGGTGKTPCVIELVKHLRFLGLRPAVIIRGYTQARVKKNRRQQSFLVRSDSSIYKTGDEARLIYNATGCPVVVGKNRLKSIKLLLNNNLANIIISDDGLQHYKLKRDLEICIIDDSRLFGNNKLLPAGPLREPVKRLNKCDYILSKINHQPQQYSKTDFKKLINNPNCHFNIYSLILTANKLVNIANGKKIPIKDFINDYITDSNNIIYAFAGIGNNHNFFNTLSSLAINNIRYREFIDHYHYQVQDFDILKKENNLIITTEKDAVKINHIKNNITNSENIFYLPVNASFDLDFIKSFTMDIIDLAKKYNLKLKTGNVNKVLKTNIKTEEEYLV